MCKLVFKLICLSCATACVIVIHSIANSTKLCDAARGYSRVKVANVLSANTRRYMLFLRCSPRPEGLNALSLMVAVLKTHAQTMSSHAKTLSRTAITTQTAHGREDQL